MSRPTRSTFTAAFRHEFEAETASLLHRRFVWFCGLMCALALLVVLTRFMVGSPDPLVPGWWYAAATAADGLRVAVFGWAIWFIRRHRPRLEALLTLALGMMIFETVLIVLLSRIEALAYTGGSPGLSLDAGAGSASASQWGAGWRIAGVHILASAFLPWTPRQAIRPLIPALALNAAAVAVLGPGGFFERAALIAISPLAALPGTAICWVRHSRRLHDFKFRFLQRRYGEVRRELIDARRLHESLFPDPCEDGPIRFCYRYEPMRQIGGDFLHAHHGPDGSLNLVVLDVTGHGIAAALTVNRVQGELHRIFAEDPDAGPGRVLGLLNRYVHLTLAAHSVYMTALCVRIRAGESLLEYASGGHPPAFLRGADGTIDQLGSTAFVLGACSDADFRAEERARPFFPGDALLAYTDGATEARNAAGRMLGIDGLLRTLAGVDRTGAGELAQRLLDTVTTFRHGPPGDDTLIVEVTRPVSAVVTPPGASPAAAAAK